MSMVKRAIALSGKRKQGDWLLGSGKGVIGSRRALGAGAAVGNSILDRGSNQMNQTFDYWRSFPKDFIHVLRRLQR